MKKFIPKLAIETLRHAKTVADTNEPINRREKRFAQAKLERDTSDSIHSSIKALSQHQAILAQIQKLHQKHKEK